MLLATHRTAATLVKYFSANDEVVGLGAHCILVLVWGQCKNVTLSFATLSNAAVMDPSLFKDLAITAQAE